jgi:hypothetical protein
MGQGLANVGCGCGGCSTCGAAGVAVSGVRRRPTPDTVGQGLSLHHVPPRLQTAPFALSKGSPTRHSVTHAGACCSGKASVSLLTTSSARRSGATLHARHAFETASETLATPSGRPTSSTAQSLSYPVLSVPRERQFGELREGPPKRRPPPVEGSRICAAPGLPRAPRGEHTGWLRLNLDMGRLNLGGLEARDNANNPMTHADLQRPIPVWSPAPRSWRASRTGGAQSLPRCLPTYVVEHGDGWTPALGAKRSPAASADVLCLPLGDIFRALVYQTAGRRGAVNNIIECPFGSVSFRGPDLLEWERRNYEYQLASSAVLQVFVPMTFAPLAQGCRAPSEYDREAFRVDGFFAGVGPLEPPTNGRPDPRTGGVVGLVGGGRPGAFGGAPLAVEPLPLSQGGPLRFVSSGILTTGLRPSQGDSPGLGFKPPAPHPGALVHAWTAREDTPEATDSYPNARAINQQFTRQISSAGLACPRVGFLLTVAPLQLDPREKPGADFGCPGDLGLLTEVSLIDENQRLVTHRFSRVPGYFPRWVPPIFGDGLTARLNTDYSLPICQVSGTRTAVAVGGFSNVPADEPGTYSLSCLVDSVWARFISR